MPVQRGDRKGSFPHSALNKFWAMDLFSPKHGLLSELDLFSAGVATFAVQASKTRLRAAVKV